ncbi:hypothetical protein MTO96_011685 [Rhipicephalus appendiculatus]
MGKTWSVAPGQPVESKRLGAKFAFIEEKLTAPRRPSMRDRDSGRTGDSALAASLAARRGRENKERGAARAGARIVHTVWAICRARGPPSSSPARAAACGG